MLIPRIIHQTYPTASIPRALADNIGRLKEMNPGWEHRFYDDAAVERFIARHYDAGVNAAFHSIDKGYGAARADLFRYLLMYKIGGVYLDMKSSTARPLDEIIRPDDTYVVSHWPNAIDEPYPNWGRFSELVGDLPAGEFQQWHIIASRRHPILMDVLSFVLGRVAGYDARIHGVGRWGVLRTTGPIAYTRAILRSRHQPPPRIVRNHIELGLVYSVMEQDGKYAHRKAFGQDHYTKQTKPVVQRASAGG